MPGTDRRPPAIAKQRIMRLSYGRAVTGGIPEDEERFREKIAARLGTGIHVTPLGRARSGIYLLAKFAVRPGRRKVLMSPYTIPDVVTMVLLAGGEPVFFDFEPGTTSCNITSLRALIDNETACVLVTHYHVNEPRLAEIAEICHAHETFLFDDCAISFGGSLYGQPIGTLTDASVFSFSAFKLLNFFWGGMITTSNSRIGAAVQEAVSEWPRLTLGDYLTAARGCAQYDLASRPPLFGSLVFPLIKKRMTQSADARTLENTRIETESLNATLTSRPALAAFAEWWPKIGQVDEWLRRRRLIAQIYRHYLAKHMVSSGVPDAVLEGSCFVNFPVLLPPGSATKIFQSMIITGFDIGKSLYPNVHRHPKFTNLAGQSENVSHLAAHTVYLPTHFGVSEDYAHAIAERLASEIGTVVD